MLDNSLDRLSSDNTLNNQNSLIDEDPAGTVFGMTMGSVEGAMHGHTPEEILPLETIPMGMAGGENLMGQHSDHNLGGHLAMLDLAPHNRATHVAVKNGHWFNPGIWQNGQVPGDDADVLIPQGRNVWYGRESEARLDTLRVDGNLRFASKRDTKMLIDTFVVAPQGKLRIGLEDLPIQANKKAQIIFTSDTAIDPELDPQQLGKGLISHGKAAIYGADKLDFVALKQDALKGDRELLLELPKGQLTPLGWQIGDSLVLGGTSYSHRADDADNSRYHDEVLTITAIEGDRIRFTNNDLEGDRNDVLRFNHQRPKGFEDKLDLYVANTTRNVSFSTENGDDVPIKNRGHVMFMHNPEVVVENAGFYDLGRTDKNQLIDDPMQNIDGSVGTGKNPRGRYAVHFHKMGLDDPKIDPAIARGNAVVGSPGWGLVHHASNAVFEDNVVFDVVGAGIVAEAGNELGAWRNNMTIKTTGDDNREDLDLNGPREFLFDFGFNGEGYWVQGAAQVEMTDNVAISSRAGVAFFGSDQGSEHLREAQTIPVAHLPESLQDIALGTEDPSVIDVSGVPIRKLSGFESYNSGVGILSWGRMQNKNGQLNFSFGAANQVRPAHNYRSLIDDFKLWNIAGNGVALKYNSNVDLESGLILGKPQRKNSAGIDLNDSSNRLYFSNLRIENFVNGIEIPYDAGKDFVGSKIEDSYFTRNLNNFAITNGQLVIEPGTEDFPEFFQIGDNNTFASDKLQKNTAPRAKFTSHSLGGTIRKFNASASFDPDSELLAMPSQGIVSYGWDFDSDGEIDRFGRQVRHRFDTLGNHDVTLTVWDSQGATSKLQKTINVKRFADRNVLTDGGFKLEQSFGLPGKMNSVDSDLGWLATQNLQSAPVSDSGALVISENGSRSAIAQVVRDERLLQGQQTFSIDLKNIEGIDRPYNHNQIEIDVWGINGEFRQKLGSTDDPLKVGALPLDSQKLLDESVGGYNFDWQTFNWDVDLGNGYEFLVVQILGTRIGHADDYVAIDNVRLR